MFKLKTLGNIALSVFAITFVYQVFTKSFTNQGGELKKYAEESEAGARRVEEAFAESRAATESLSTDTSADSSTLEETPNQSSSFRFPQASCGDKPTGGNDTWFPVFLDGADLANVQANYCADAVATKRKDTGVETVQLASFTNRDQAISFAKAIGGKADVGRPTYSDGRDAPILPNPEEEPVSSPSTARASLEPLILNAFSWQPNNSSLVEVEGQVTNSSDSPISSLQVLVEFYSVDGQFITSQSAPIAFNPLMPGQVSPLKVLAKYNPQMHTAKIR